MSNPKAIILLTVFIDVIGLGIVIPILPFYVAQFSNSALLITSLFAVFALCSFLSAPIIGALSDRVGRRPMLIASIFSTSLGWFVFALAPSILFLFIGRIIDGVMAGNFPIAQSYLSDVAKDDKERSANFGLIGAVFGIAFILGPFLGGVLGHFGHNIPFCLLAFWLYLTEFWLYSFCRKLIILGVPKPSALILLPRWSPPSVTIVCGETILPGFCLAWLSPVIRPYFPSTCGMFFLLMS